GQGIPPSLDNLILKLLEKDPRDRIGYAAHVAAELAALGADAEPDEGPPPRAYLYRSRFLGRKDALTTLKTMVSRLVDQRHGGLVLIRGESGVGKTRLVREVARRAVQRQRATGKKLTVLTGYCVAPGAGDAEANAAVASPLHPLRPVLEAATERAQHSRAE